MILHKVQIAPEIIRDYFELIHKIILITFELLQTMSYVLILIKPGLL